MQLPAAFIQSIQNCPGFDANNFEQVHHSGEQVTSVRINPFKRFAENGSFIINGVVPWANNGRYLSERPSFTLDPCFHAGAYYVQEASSMFLEQALKQSVNPGQPINVLDLCAAPGGKSTLIQSLISSDSILVSNEVIRTRVNVLSENITRWGAANVIVTNNDAKDFQRLPGFFDVIVVDAPCSGSGLFRKDPEAMNEWSKQNVELCSQRQQRILADVLPSLKQNGILIYSTCSYSEEEDENIADWLIEELQCSTIQLATEKSWGIVESLSPKHKAFGYRFYPDKLKGEGFFISVFSKGHDEEIEMRTGRLKAKNERPSGKDIDIIKPFLKAPHDFFFIRQHAEVLAVPAAVEEKLAVVQSALYLKKAGVKLGTIIRNELVPDHELALSNLLNESVASINVSREMALEYLRKKEIPADTILRGWALIKYEQLSLGWIKILPNRINNYYPKEWRILNK